MTYNEKNKHYTDQNKLEYIIELYCKQHSIDRVVCNKYGLEINEVIIEYNDATFMIPRKIKILGKIEL